VIPDVGTKHKIACIGDLMTVFDGGALPRVHRTSIVDRTSYRLGGGAFNLAWHLTSLGRQAILLAACGDQEFPSIISLFDTYGLIKSGVEKIHGPSDALVIFKGDEGTRSFYLCGDLSTKIVESFITKAKPCDWIVFSGSRHPEVRAKLSSLLDSSRETKLVFAPSYAIYAFSSEEIRTYLSSADIIVFNGPEEEFIRCEQGFGHLLDDRNKISIVTLGSDGAKIREGEATYAIPSYSGTRGDVLGAGEAFLAGYLDKHFDGSSGFIAGRYGAIAASDLIQTKNSPPVLDSIRLGKRLDAILAREQH
jgi:sugar/nucleoside kinase (ribokinase family)